MERSYGVGGITVLGRATERAGLAWWYRQFAQRDAVLPRGWSRRRTQRGAGLWGDPLRAALREWRRGAKVRSRMR
jgi:hypothetical protein